MKHRYWVMSTHLGHQAIVDRFEHLAQAVEAAGERQKKTGYIHEVLEVEPAAVGDTVSGWEFWTTTPIDLTEEVCGRYATYDKAVSASRACAKMSGKKHYILRVKVVRL